MLGMVVFFPTSRYRVPGLILLIPYAAEIAVRVFDRMRSGAAHGDRVWSPGRTGAVAVALLFVVVNPIASNMFRHPVKERAEHSYFNTLWEKDKLRVSQSVSGQKRMLALASETMSIDPGYAEPVHFLALYYLDHDITRSVALFEKLNELVPNDASVLRQLQAATIMRDEQVSGP